MIKSHEYLALSLYLSLSLVDFLPHERGSGLQGRRPV